MSLGAQEQDPIAIKGENVSIFDSTKSNYKPDIRLGNPTNKDVEMALDDTEAPFYRYKIIHSKPWFDFKKKLNKDTGWSRILALSPTVKFVVHPALNQIVDILINVKDSKLTLYLKGGWNEEDCTYYGSHDGFDINDLC